MKAKTPLIILGLFVVVAAAWVLLGGVPGEGRAPVRTTTAANAAGYVIEVDPVTGKPVTTPTRTAPLWHDEALQNALSTSSEGLVEERSPVPGGGVSVDLQGRFQNTFVASVDDSGRVEATCVSSPPEEDEGGERR